ncbi:uncharacterized protein [Temnothorax longispinosus]|uniref:uncharacterized protein isoform X3 n=1 Tax=Temnothorax longispinosus TaxID=300112 RepID=UPI003A9A2B2C
MPKRCAVPGCNTNKKLCNKNYSVFNVPSEENLREKWAAAIPGIQYLKSHQYICERHFSDEWVVRKWVKHDADGEIIVEVPYKRIRLMHGAMPTIFDSQSAKDSSLIKIDESNNVHDTVSIDASIDVIHEDQDAGGQNELVSLTVNTEHLHDNAAIVMNINGVSSLPDQGIPSQNEDISKAVYTDRIEPTDILIGKEFEDTNISSAANRTPEIEPSDTSIVFLQFRVTHGSQITFWSDPASPEDVMLSSSWTATTAFNSKTQKLIISQISINTDSSSTPVLSKSITIDSDRMITYYVHGKVVKENHQDLPRILSTPQRLQSIIMNFQSLRVCNGLGLINVDLKETNAAVKDNLNVWRSNKCLLIGQRKKCNMCAKLRKLLKQKALRHVKRVTVKRVRVLSNSMDQKKLSILRKKINVERRLRNRQKFRIKLLTDSLTQKQDEFVALKDQLLEERCNMFNVPETQKKLLQEIIAAAKTKNPNGRRYTKEWLMLCILMNVRSPGYYDFLRRNNIVPLPCTRTIRGYLSLIDSKCGFDEKFFQLLKKKMQCKKPIQRHGLLVLDEINLRRSVTVSSKNLCYSGLTDFGDDGPKASVIDDQATHGLVFLFQPLADTFTQPIAVFASKGPVKGEELAKLALKAIALLETSGVFIHGIISDGAHTNAKMGSILGIERSIHNTKTWFTHPLNSERQVFVFSDVPHLIKNIRNRLYNKRRLRLSANRDWVEWKYFEKLFKVDTMHPGNARACPKISQNHIKLDSVSKMRVRLATQIFSNSVADGLRFYSSHRYDGFTGCEETIKFCKQINDMFDALNRKMPNQGLTLKTKDFEILQSSLQWLDDWENAKIRGDISSDEFLTTDTANGLRLSLISTMDLCKYLITNFKFEYLLTGKVNQDNLEKFFGTIRQAAGSNDHPSCSTFLQLYKLLSMYSMIRPPIYGNCTITNNKPTDILFLIDDLLKIYGRKDTKSSQVINKLRYQLDKLIEHEEWEMDELKDNDYALPHVLDCIVYYVTGFYFYNCIPAVRFALYILRFTCFFFFFL